MRISTLLAFAATVFTVEAAPKVNYDMADVEPYDIAVPQYKPKVYNSSLEMTMDPMVPLIPPARWTVCSYHTRTCASLCNDWTNANACEPDTFEWDCRCGANDSMPGLQYYAGSIPSYICRFLNEACTRDAATEVGEALCNTTFFQHCGRLTPTHATRYRGKASLEAWPE